MGERGGKKLERRRAMFFGQELQSLVQGAWAEGRHAFPSEGECCQCVWSESCRIVTKLCASLRRRVGARAASAFRFRFRSCAP